MDIIVNYIEDIVYNKHDIMEEYLDGCVVYPSNPSNQSVWMNNMIIWI